jgi:hypothetical protein
MRTLSEFEDYSDFVLYTVKRPFVQDYASHSLPRDLGLLFSPSQKRKTK